MAVIGFRALVRHSARCALAVLVIAGASCGPRIPMKAGDDEYAVYAAWMAQHFKEKPLRLILANRTFVYDPFERCRPNELTKSGISSEMVRALHDLGDAEFGIMTAKFEQPRFRIP